MFSGSSTPSNAVERSLGVTLIDGFVIVLTRICTSQILLPLGIFPVVHEGSTMRESMTIGDYAFDNAIGC